MMNAQVALEYVDDHVFRVTGQRLSDLERLVFIGSWQGQPYRDIYPPNPDYVEKSVGYRLWRKLSHVLGEKVTKKRLHGAIARAYAQPSQTRAASPVGSSQRWVIGYPPTLLGQAVARSLQSQVAARGHQVLTIELETTTPHQADCTPPLGDRFQTVAADCDGLIILVAGQITFSDWIVQTLRSLRSRPLPAQFIRPQIFTVRLAASPQSPGFSASCDCLQGTRQWDWQSDRDTGHIIQDVLQHVG